LFKGFGDLTTEGVIPIRLKWLYFGAHRVVAIRPTKLMLLGVLLNIGDIVSEWLFAQVLPYFIHC